MTEEKDDWIVNEKYCEGCKYYGYLSNKKTGGRCCDYTYRTGKARQNPPKSCEAKEIGPRIRSEFDMNGNRKQGGRKRG